MCKLGVREFLDKKKAEGKFRFPAFSFHGKAEDFSRICDEYDWTFAQVQYNYLDTNFQAGYKGIKYAVDKGIGVIVMEPLKGGKLGNKIPLEMASVINASGIKKSPAEWALRFVWNESGVSSILSGMNNMGQVVENINIANNALPDSLTNDELLIYGKLRNSVSKNIKADCTDCKYCMPCSSGVDIPEVLASLNHSAVWNETNPWLTGYIRVKGKAGKCTECKECEEVCPQELPISALMKEAMVIFKE
jgi:predicted aldo/keto reductase-like oxidoreductase